MKEASTSSTVDLRPWLIRFSKDALFELHNMSVRLRVRTQQLIIPKMPGSLTVFSGDVVSQDLTEILVQFHIIPHAQRRGLRLFKSSSEYSRYRLSIEWSGID